MPNELSGPLDGSGLRVGLAVSRFNSAIVENLVGGAVEGLTRNGTDSDAITIARCPGAWELPLVCKRMAASGKFDAIIALGAVIRGETSHFDHLVNECVKGLGATAMQTDIPVIFGVLTTDTVEQAMNRAGIKHGNKGFECALAAIEMCHVLRAI